jgi:MFS family permease
VTQRGRGRGLFQAGNFLYWLSLYFYVPILAVYATGMGASLSLVGVMLSAYGVMQLALRIPLGIASDVLGRRKPFVIAGPALAAIGAAGFLLAPAPGFLVASRAVTGLAACAWVAITVMYSGYYPPAEAARAIGAMGLTNGLGQVIATYTGGVAAGAYGWPAPFLLSVVTGVAGMGLMALCPEPRAARRAAVPVSWERLWSIGTSRGLLTVSLLAAMNSYLNFSTVFGFTPVYAKAIGATPTELGLLTAVSLVPFALAQPLNAPAARRLGFVTTVGGGLALSGAMIAVVPLTHAFPALVATQVVGGVGRGFLSASLMSLAILAVDQRERATAMGVYQAIYSIGMFLGPLSSGFIGQRFGLGPVFVSSGLLSVGAAVVACFTLPRE